MGDGDIEGDINVDSGPAKSNGLLNWVNTLKGKMTRALIVILIANSTRSMRRISAQPSKNAVSANMKHSRYFH